MAMTALDTSAHDDLSDEQGIIIMVGGQDPDYSVTARLMASIARPPTSERDPKWRELVRAVSRVILQAHQQADPRPFEQPLPYPAADLTFPLARAEDLVQAALSKVNVALGAAHAQMPALVRGVGIRNSSPGITNYRLWKHEVSLVEGSQRTMEREQEFLAFQQQHEITLPTRFPREYSAQSEVNFRNRVVAPYRNVLHLAAGLAMVLDDVERRLTSDLAHQPGVAKASGFGAYPTGVRLLADHLFLIPELAIAAINRARTLEAGLPYLTSQRPKPSEVVRLRWRHLP